MEKEQRREKTRRTSEEEGWRNKEGSEEEAKGEKSKSINLINSVKTSRPKRSLRISSET